MSHRVFHAMLAFGQSDGALHLVPIVLQHSHDVLHHWKRNDFNLARGRALHGALGFGEAIEEKIAGSKTAVSRVGIGLVGDGFLACLNGSFISGSSVSGEASEQTERIEGIRLLPR